MNHEGTILAVDDDPEALALLMRVLGGEGYQVQPADSGRLALISVAAQPPDLVLLDLRMPGMDGFEVCRRIKETEEGRAIPVIFLSASKEIEECLEGLALGAVDFISKPFRREELLARVHTHLELGRLQSKLEMRVLQRTEELRNCIEQLLLEAAERRRAEVAARESEVRFRRIANAAPVIIWTSDASGQVDFRNVWALEFTGRTMDQLAGDGWEQLLQPDHLKNYRRSWTEGIASRTGFQLEYMIRRADGEYRDMLDRGIPHFLPDGEFAGYVGTVVDLTDIKRSQERAFTAQNLENLRVLSAGIAHDFNTLIGAIFGEADLALSDFPAGFPGRDNIERIVGVAKRAAEIVRLLMVYAGSRSDDTKPELTDINSLVQEIVPHLRASILKGAEIRTNLAMNLPSVWAKGLEIRQVLLNLIINAVEAFEGKAGTVTITTGHLEIGQSPETGYPHELPEGRYVRLEVLDSGNGMSKEVQARVFDPYYTTKFLGRGLGLAAVQGIIRSHGGLINATSKPGEGAAFEVFLPVADN